MLGYACMRLSLILERSLENLSCMHTKNILRHVRGVVCGVFTEKIIEKKATHFSVDFKDVEKKLHLQVN